MFSKSLFFVSIITASIFASPEEANASNLESNVKRYAYSANAYMQQATQSANSSYRNASRTVTRQYQRARSNNSYSSGGIHIIK